MGLPKLTLISLLFPLSLGAETASDYVHRGAQKYIFGHEEAAESEVEEGLAKFPNDEELRGMLALFKKKPPQDQQNDQKDQKQNQDQQKQEQENGGNEGNDQNKNQPTPAPSQDQDQNQHGPGESPSPTATPGSSPPENQPGQSPSPGPGDEDGNENGQPPTPSPAGTPREPLTGAVRGAGEERPEGTPNAQLAEAEAEKEGEMTPKQAAALLESMKDEEQKVQLDEHRAVRPVYKDW